MPRSWPCAQAWQCTTLLHVVLCVLPISGSLLPISGASALPRRQLLSSLVVCATPLSCHALIERDDARDDRRDGRECDAMLLQGSPVSPVLDPLHCLDSEARARLCRIVGKLQDDTGFRLRVLTQDRSSASCARRALELWRISSGSGGSVVPDAIVLIAERGIEGSLEAGSPLLKFLVGDDVLLPLPPIFWSRLRREYGGASFVKSRGEAASVVTSCELIISCLRNEAFCVTVPPASSSFF